MEEGRAVRSPAFVPRYRSLHWRLLQLIVDISEFKVVRVPIDRGVKVVALATLCVVVVWRRAQI